MYNQNFDDDYAQKGKLGLLLRKQLKPKNPWAADNGTGNTDEAKREYAKMVASSLTAAALVILAPYIGTVAVIVSAPVVLISMLHANLSANNHKLANVDGLLSDRDTQALKELIMENSKLADELSKYKGQKVSDLPPDLRKRSYKAIMAEYESMKNLKLALARIK